jgi:hypothetical protein
MNMQSETLFGNVDFPRKWNDLILSSADQWIALSFDYVQQSVESCTKRMRAACSELDNGHDPSRWSEITQATARETIESTRALISAVSDFQLEAQQLFRDQTAEANKLIESSLNQKFSPLKSVEAEAKSGIKDSAYAQKLAA